MEVRGIIYKMSRRDFYLPELRKEIFRAWLERSLKFSAVMVVSKFTGAFLTLFYYIVYFLLKYVSNVLLHLVDRILFKFYKTFILIPE